MSQFFVRAVKNKNFECNHDILERIFYDARNLCKEIANDSEQNIEMYLSYVGYILAHIMFSRGNNRSQFVESVDRVTAYFETVVDVFHPMTPKSFQNYFFKKIFSNFVGTYVKQFRKYTGTDTIDIGHIKQKIHPVIRKILTFATISFYWEGLEEALIDLSCLDEEYFLDEIMSKIKMGYNFDAFRKIDILRSLSNLSLFLRTPKTCHHLDWLVPKLVDQMELSASDHLELVTKSLISIIQNFIKVVDTNHDHLKPKRNMIIDAAQKIVTFYYNKGDTFVIDSHHMDVLMGVGSKVRNTLKMIVIEGIKHNFFTVKPSVAEIYTNALLEYFPEEGEKIILNWIKDNVIVNREKPEPAGNLGVY